MSTFAHDNLLEKGDKVFWSPRNYNNRGYTYNTMKSHFSANQIWSQLTRDVIMSKAACLNKAQRDIETQMIAIEKDDDYLPDFKECVKSTVMAICETRAQLAEKGLNKGLVYELNPDNADTAIERGLDITKLEELRETDLRVYGIHREEIIGKWVE